MWQLEVPPISARRESRAAGVTFLPPDGSAKQAKAARMSVDDGDADRCAGTQAEFVGGLGREPAADPLTHGADSLPDALELFLRQITQPDLLEVRFIPPCAVITLVSQVGPFANQAAERAGLIARRAVGQVIGQVEEASGATPGFGQMFFQPEKLRRLHFG